MLVVYASKTGNIARFIRKAGLDDSTTLRILSGDESVGVSYILVTYTTSLGSIPVEVDSFVSHNYKHCTGVVGSGNSNYGQLFCNAAKSISKQYSIPLLMTFEGSGFDSDISKFKQLISSAPLQ